MSYLDTVLSGLPNEMKCEVYYQLVDLQQESARKILRICKPEYLIDIECLEIDGFPMNTPFAVNKLVYFRAAYRNSSRYRDEMRNLIPVEKMDSDSTILSKTNDMQRYVAEATWIWNYLRNHRYNKIEKIFIRYLRSKACRSKWRPIIYNDEE
jgi:hypothetical protein